MNENSRGPRQPGHDRIREERPPDDFERRPAPERRASAQEASFTAAIGTETPPPSDVVGVMGDREPTDRAGGRPDAQPAPVTKFARGLAELRFIGTATVLLDLAGFTILTDPNFVRKGRRVGLGYGIKTERLTDPAIEINELPHVDLGIVSHLHGDHFDRLSSAMLDRTMPLVTTSAASMRLKMMSFRDVTGLDTWRSQDYRKGDTRIRVTAMPARHAPGPLAPFLPDVMGSLIDLSIGREQLLRIYISGDTLIHDRMRQIPQRFHGIDLAILHLGGERLAGAKLTMDGQDGVECMRILGPGAVIPVHFDDYSVFKSPISDFRAAVEDAGLADRVRYVARGESVDIADLAATVRQVEGVERLLGGRLMRT